MSNAEAAKAPDGRLRAFRVGAYVFHILFSTVFALLVGVSVVRSVREMSPPRTHGRVSTLSIAACTDGAKGLWRELDARRAELTSFHPVRQADASWVRFRMGWLHAHRSLEASCIDDSPERRGLRELFTRLDRTMDLYTTHAVQFAGEVGPGVDALTRLLAAQQR